MRVQGEGKTQHTLHSSLLKLGQKLRHIGQFGRAHLEEGVLLCRVSTGSCRGESAAGGVEGKGRKRNGILWEGRTGRHEQESYLQGAKKGSPLDAR